MLLQKQIAASNDSFAELTKLKQIAEIEKEEAIKALQVRVVHKYNQLNTSEW